MFLESRIARRFFFFRILLRNLEFFGPPMQILFGHCRSDLRCVGLARPFYQLLAKKNKKQIKKM